MFFKVPTHTQLQYNMDYFSKYFKDNKSVSEKVPSKLLKQE